MTFDYINFPLWILVWTLASTRRVSIAFASVASKPKAGIHRPTKLVFSVVLPQLHQAFKNI